jgi:hypothetical protein
VQGRNYWYEGEWWANCQPPNFPAYINYTYLIGDSANIDMEYPDICRIPIKIIPTAFQWDMETESQPSLSNFRKEEGEYFVSERIRPDLSLPFPPGIVRILSKKYYFGKNRIPEDEFYTIKPGDIGNREVFAHVECKTEKGRNIHLRFQKSLKISLPPFEISPKSISSYVQGAPQWFKVPFSDVRGLPDEIRVPFSCRIAREQVVIMASLTVPDLDTRSGPFPVYLNRGDTGFEVAFRPGTGLSSGEYSLDVAIDAEKYIRNPINYHVKLRIFPLWPFIVGGILLLALATYGILLVIHSAFARFPAHSDQCRVISGSGEKTWRFPLRFFPPGRYETERDREGKKVCRCCDQLCLEKLFQKRRP